MDYQTIIQSRFEDMLQSHSHLSLKDKHIHFSLEYASLYENWILHKSDIIEESLVNDFLQNIAKERSWIHANLIPTEDQNFLITIRVGAKVGNPNPSINISFQKNKIVRIID